VKRFLLLALVLAVPLTVATGAVSVLVFRHVDLRFGAFLQLLVIPFLQAAVVLWVAGAWGLDRLAAAARKTWRRPAVVAFLAGDAALLAAGWLLHSRRLVGLAAPASVHPSWTGIKAGVAALLLLLLALRAIGTRLERLWFLLFAVAVSALAAEFVYPWLGDLPTLVRGKMPTILRWLLIYGGLFVTAMAALLHTGAVLARRSALAGFFVDASAACATVAAIVAVASVFLRPFLIEPWLSVVRSGVSLSMTFLLAASLAALGPRGAAGSGDVSHRPHTTP